MTVKFTTAGPMDFTKYWYVIAVNTQGPPYTTATGMPYPLYGNQGQNWTNFSFEFIVYELQGQNSPQVAVYQFVNVPIPGQPAQKTPIQVGYTAGDVLLTCTTATTFCLQINREIFAGIVSPLPSSSPSASPSPSPTASPSASPSAAPSGSPSASPSASPPPTQTPTVWVNWFTVLSANNQLGNPQVNTGTVVDAPGPGSNAIGATTWTPPGAPYNTANRFDVTWNAVLGAGGWMQASDAAAQIAAGEVLNIP